MQFCSFVFQERQRTECLRAAFAASSAPREAFCWGRPRRRRKHKRLGGFFLEPVNEWVHNGVRLPQSRRIRICGGDQTRSGCRLRARVSGSPSSCDWPSVASPRPVTKHYSKS
eukprot:TRINITY_DN3886_c0_g1_i6.p6 TRINITY_DN3886_c0_g1~~TRINITY_DN3886_c0_g1_i6.p6  ORF type:complete len:113 (-),score=3.31 TRINITY_DN3886_c0_g1_i6:1044-1382(-)